MALPRPGALPTVWIVSANPIRNFTLSAEERIRAIASGPPAWAVRKRKIEDACEACAGDLVALYDKLAASATSAREIEAALTRAAERLDLAKLNALVETHNRYYPIEANLPMDRTGAYLAYGRAWEPEEPFTPARLLDMARAVLAQRST
jgi:hypothetical protein